MSDRHATNSFLRRAPNIDSRFLDVNQLPTISSSVNDELYEISAGYDERPDLLADKLYGSTRLWWVFALRNPNELKDPLRDFKSGVTIMLPSRESVRKITEGSVIGV